MKVGSLQKLSRKVVILWLCSQSLDRYDVSGLYHYLLRAAPLLTDLAIACQYYDNPGFTRLFLPVLVQKGQLHVTAENVREILRYWKTSNTHETLSTLIHLRVDDIEGPQYLSLIPFLGHLVNLRVLVIGLSVNDDLMAVLGVNCPHLAIFDAREDTGNLVTDLGLAYLRLCRRLKRIYFSCFADEYDCTLDRLSFSGKGVALLLSLPEVEHVHCSEYLLRDALIYLYQTTYCQQALSIQFIFLDHPEVSLNAIQILPILCPKLRAVSLFANSKNELTIGNMLKSLVHLKALAINTDSHSKFESLKFPSYGSQLTYLFISAWILEGKDLVYLSQSCTQLKTFVLKMWSFGFECLSVDQIKGPLFPTVEKLELLQNISVKLYRWLNIKMENLKEVHCSSAMIHNLDQTLKMVVEKGGWRNLEVLTLPMSCEVSQNVAQLIATSLPNLSHIAVSVAERDEIKLWNFLDKTVPHVKLVDHSNVDSPSTSGIFSQDIWSTSLLNSFGKLY